MTVSTSVVVDFTRDMILRTAIRRAGLNAGRISDPSAQMLEQAADNLELVIKSLQSEDINLGTIEPTTLVLTSGVSLQTLASDAIDIAQGQSDNLGTIVNTDNSESVVKSLDRDGWLRLADKTVSGRPTMGYFQKGPACKVLFWPVPDVAYTFRYTKVRLFKSGGSGANTIDARSPWAEYFVYATAEGLAMDNRLMEAAGQLGAKAEKLRERCLTGEANHGTIRFRVGKSARNW
jgi:hypothetical protein